MIKLIEIRHLNLDFIVYADGERKTSFNEMSDDYAFTNCDNYVKRLKQLEGSGDTVVIDQRYKS